MRLALSRHVSIVHVAPDLFVVGHAFKGPRDVVDAAQRAQLEAFREPRDVEVIGKVTVWVRQGILVEEGEDDRLAGELGAHVESVRAAVRRTQMRSRVDPRLRLRLAPSIPPSAPRDRWKVIYIGLCLVLPTTDAVAELAADHGCDVEAIGTFPSDLALIDEQQPDFVVLGDLPRVGLGYRDDRPVQYIAALRALLDDVRRRTSAPVLVRNLPGPTCSLAGLADRGAESHINKVRAINIAIAALAEEYTDVWVVDIDQALSLAGKNGLVDDQVVLSHHLASLTWLAERASREPVPGSTHDAGTLLRAIDIPRERLEAEYVLAAEDLRVMLALRGVGRRKVIVVDLDETLWPGVLAETGAPFPPHLAEDVHPHHLYLGLHEALLALRDRGFLLACVSKNDADVVRALWTYPPALAHATKLVLDDFVTHRIGWGEKVDSIVEIARELDLGLDTFAFIDDNPHERERVRARLPDVMVLGENPFGVRWQLLTHPAFQIPHVTDEARRRPEMVRAQLHRERERVAAPDPAAFAASLDMRVVIRRSHDDIDRVLELVHRTTQLNTTGEKPSRAELERCTIYTLSAVDRFADYGLVGACIVDGDTIRQLVTSCRVIGLGLDHLLVYTAAADVAAPVITGRSIATARNQPARHVFASCGFARDPSDSTRWTATRASLIAPTLPYVVRK